MSARITWLLLSILSVLLSFHALYTGVHRVRNQHAAVMMLVSVSLVIALLMTWRTAAALIRFLRHPLQKSQKYLVEGQPNHQFLIAPIVIEGPCLLVFSSELDLVGVAIDHVDSARPPRLRYLGFQRMGVDFRIPQGLWPLRIVV